MVPALLARGRVDQTPGPDTTVPRREVLPARKETQAGNCRFQLAKWHFLSSNYSRWYFALGGRVGGVYRCTAPPSEPCLPLARHTAQANSLHKQCLSTRVRWAD